MNLPECKRQFRTLKSGIRQLVRSQPLETAVIDHQGIPITIPANAEILRIKAVLIRQGHRTREYLDVTASAMRMSAEALVSAMEPFDTGCIRKTAASRRCSTLLRSCRTRNRET